MEDSSSIFKERLNAAMKAKGYSNAALARETHLSAAAIGNYVKGRMPRGCDEIVRLARTLDTTPDYLLGFSDDKMPQKVGKFQIENYADVVHAIDSIISCFATMLESGDDENWVTIKILDHQLQNFLKKRHKLYTAMGDIIKPKLFNLAYDDLWEEMRQVKVDDFLAGLCDGDLSVDNLGAKHGDDNPTEE